MPTKKKQAPEHTKKIVEKRQETIRNKKLAQDLLKLENCPLTNPKVWEKVDLDKAEKVKTAIDEGQQAVKAKKIKALEEEIRKLKGEA